MASSNSVHALLLVNGGYVLQLRDDRPDIAAPGQWGLFGGELEENEHPKEGMIREIGEELGIQMDDCELFWSTDRYSSFRGVVNKYWFFEADISRHWSSHIVREGRDARVFSFKEVARLPMTALSYEVLQRHHAKRRMIGGGCTSS